MRLAFLISAHTDPIHLRRMIGSLPPASVFIVHVDAKSKLNPFTDLITDPRVFFIQERTDVMWGSIGVVEAQMKMIRKALQLNQQEPIDYLISLSGLDYPLWSNQRINDFFVRQPGKDSDVSG